MDLTSITRKNVSLLNKDGTTSIMCHVEAIRQELVIQVFNCFLQDDDVPIHRNVFFGNSFSTPRSWAPIINTEPPLFGQSVGHVVVEVVLTAICRVFSGRCIAARCVDTLAVDRVTPQSNHEVCFHPCRNPSRVDETPSSYPDTISSSRYGKTNRLGKGPNCFGWM